MSDWLPTACNLCECNCGLEIQLGGENDRHFTRIRGDKLHPGSEGYACEKPHRLDYYQNGRDRILNPLRRRSDGTFEEIDWDTAISEVAAKLVAIRDEHGGDKIFYYGGGGQGNHLPGAYSGATLAVLGNKFRANALSQEKTGEMWVTGKMFGAGTRGDFEHAEVSVFVGKNPWQSHGIARARVTLKQIKADPARAMIVIDPCVTETAAMADFHLQVKPGGDAWLLAAMAGVLVQEDLVDHDFLDEHTAGADQILPLFAEIPVAEYCATSGVDEDLVRRAVRRIAAAETVSVAEDLGVQMNRHSTLVSYLQRMLWTLTGNFAKEGAAQVFTSLIPLAGGGGAMSGPRGSRTSPVTGSRIISGLTPCNVIPDEILTDHPDRFRAMIVESGNPAHSLADSQRMREALQKLDLVVVIDVAMTETAREADYVLPVATQFEKWEATFFNFEFPRNVFHLRKPLLEAPSTVLTEPEIHARLVEAMGAMPEDAIARLNAALEGGREAFGAEFFTVAAEKPELFKLAPVILFRTLGPTLPDGAASAAVLYAGAHMCAQTYPEAVKNAGFEGEGMQVGEKLFDAVLAGHSGIVFSDTKPEESWKKVRTAEARINLAIPELFDELNGLATEQAPGSSREFPFLLSAGERRSFTANTIFRDPEWRKKDAEGALRVSPGDAIRLGLVDGGGARLTTKRASVTVVVAVHKAMQDGHISLPNGLGLGYPDAEGASVTAGVAPNELTATEDRDWVAGTPWHKSVPARLEAA
ncbi:MAG: anaerobic selenocysteine-containing dehydrogenase [Hyphomicrobiaceae bacterium]|jgi:anaerobic selenocysteine-containing dehydrogenase